MPKPRAVPDQWQDTTITIWQCNTTPEVFKSLLESIAYPGDLPPFRGKCHVHVKQAGDNFLLTVSSRTEEAPNARAE